MSQPQTFGLEGADDEVIQMVCINQKIHVYGLMAICTSNSADIGINI